MIVLRGEQAVHSSAHVTSQTPQIVMTSPAHAPASRDMMASTAQTTWMNAQLTQHHVAATPTVLTLLVPTAVSARPDGREREATVIRTSMSVYFRLQSAVPMAAALISRARTTARVIRAGRGRIVTTATASLTGRSARATQSVLGRTGPIPRVSVCLDMMRHAQV